MAYRNKHMLLLMEIKTLDIIQSDEGMETEVIKQILISMMLILNTARNSSQRRIYQTPTKRTNMLKQ